MNYTIVFCVIKILGVNTEVIIGVDFLKYESAYHSAFFILKG